MTQQLTRVYADWPGFAHFKLLSKPCEAYQVAAICNRGCGCHVAPRGWASGLAKAVRHFSVINYLLEEDALSLRHKFKEHGNMWPWSKEHGLLWRPVASNYQGGESF